MSLTLKIFVELLLSTAVFGVPHGIPDRPYNATPISPQDTSIISPHVTSPPSILRLDGSIETHKQLEFGLLNPWIGFVGPQAEKYYDFEWSQTTWRGNELEEVYTTESDGGVETRTVSAHMMLQTNPGGIQILTSPKLHSELVDTGSGACSTIPPSEECEKAIHEVIKRREYYLHAGSHKILDLNKINHKDFHTAQLQILGYFYSQVHWVKEKIEYDVPYILQVAQSYYEAIRHIWPDSDNRVCKSPKTRGEEPLCDDIECGGSLESKLCTVGSNQNCPCLGDGIDKGGFPIDPDEERAKQKIWTKLFDYSDNPNNVEYQIKCGKTVKGVKADVPKEVTEDIQDFCNRSPGEVLPRGSEHGQYFFFYNPLRREHLIGGGKHLFIEMMNPEPVGPCPGIEVIVSAASCEMTLLTMFDTCELPKHGIKGEGTWEAETAQWSSSNGQCYGYRLALF